MLLTVETKRHNLRFGPTTKPGMTLGLVWFELQHQGFWPVSLEKAQVPDQRKHESSRSDSDALNPAFTRRL